jgi:hypothetical protein
MFVSCHQKVGQNCDRKAANTHLYVASMTNLKGRAIPVQAVESLRVVGGRGSHILRHSAHRWRKGCQPYAPAAFYPQEDSWYSFLLEAELTPGP